MRSALQLARLNFLLSAYEVCENRLKPALEVEPDDSEAILLQGLLDFYTYREPQPDYEAASRALRAEKQLLRR